jgi:hypothetical protein
LRDQLDPRHVLEPHDGAAEIGPQDNVAELLLGLQPALCANRIRELLSFGNRFAADLAGGV